MVNCMMSTLLQSKIELVVDLADVIGWVLLHPKKHLAFPGWFDEQITANLVEYNRFNGIIVVTMPNKRIDGIMTYDIYHEKKLIRVQAILTRDLDAFTTMIALWAERHPDYTLMAIRDGKKNMKYKLKNFSRYLKQGIENLIGN